MSDAVLQPSGRDSWEVYSGGDVVEPVHDVKGDFTFNGTGFGCFLKLSQLARPGYLPL
jgi:hypothetical protein